jgi:hypothetical protein
MISLGFEFVHHRSGRLVRLEYVDEKRRVETDRQRYRSAISSSERARPSRIPSLVCSAVFSLHAPPELLKRPGVE